jgi:hypothetical protein
MPLAAPVMTTLFFWSAIFSTLCKTVSNRAEGRQDNAREHQRPRAFKHFHGLPYPLGPHHQAWVAKGKALALR